MWFFFGQPGAGFEWYRSYFEAVTGYRTNIPIVYGKEEGLASCQYNVDAFGHWQNKVIVVNRKEFAELSVNWRRAVIAHELVHCHLEYDHHSAVHTSVHPFVLMSVNLPVSLPLSDEDLYKAVVKWRAP
jgi:hypothetical protein